MWVCVCACVCPHAHLRWSLLFQWTKQIISIWCHEETACRTNLLHYIMDLSVYACMCVGVYVCVLLADMDTVDCDHECMFYNTNVWDSFHRHCHQVILCNIPLPVCLIKKKLLKRCREWDLTGTTLSPVGGGRYSPTYSYIRIDYRDRNTDESVRRWRQRAWGGVCAGGEECGLSVPYLFFACLMTLSHLAGCHFNGCDISWDFCPQFKLCSSLQMFHRRQNWWDVRKKTCFSVIFSLLLVGQNKAKTTV